MVAIMRKIDVVSEFLILSAFILIPLVFLYLKNL
jgi:hypothetical protein